MKEINLIPTDINTRVDKILNETIEIFCSKVSSGYFELGLEASIQLQVGKILENLVNLYTLSIDESFQILLEYNMPIDSKKNYVDIVIKYTNKDIVKFFPIELKNKKKSDAAEDLGVIDSYKDIYCLDLLKQKDTNISAGYFIFFTNHSLYTRESSRGIVRNAIPLHDKVIIEKNKKYICLDTSESKKRFNNYPNGFVFSNDYKIEYNKVINENIELYYFSLKI